MKRQLTGIALVAALCLTGVATAGPAFAEGSSGTLGSESTVTTTPIETHDDSLFADALSNERASGSTASAQPAAASVKILTSVIRRPSSGCVIRDIKVSVSGLPSTVDYPRLSTTSKRGSESLYLSSYIEAKNGINTVEAQLCGGSDTLGNYRTSVKLSYYSSPSSSTQLLKSATKYVQVKGKPDITLYGSVTGNTRSKSGTKKMTGIVANDSDLKGKKLKVYFKAKGQSKYKKIANTTKVNSSGKFSIKSKKIWEGRIYLKSSNGTYVYAGKSNTVSLKLYRY